MSRILAKFETCRVNTQNAEHRGIGNTVNWQTIELFNLANGSRCALAKASVCGEFLFFL